MRLAAQVGAPRRVRDLGMEPRDLEREAPTVPDAQRSPIPAAVYILVCQAPAVHSLAVVRLYRSEPRA